MPSSELYYKPWTLFWLLQTVGLICLVLGLLIKARFYLQGTRTSLYQKPNYSLMCKTFWGEVVLQKQIAQRSGLRWLAHICMVYGFGGLLLLSVLSVGLKVIPQQSVLYQWLALGPGYNYYKAVGDICGLLIFLGSVLAGLRRFVIKDKQLVTDVHDSTALGLLMLLIVTGFGLEAMRISLLPISPSLKFSVVGFPLAAVFRGHARIDDFLTMLWVTHAAANAAFMSYLPFSKFLHIFNSPLEIMLNASEEKLRGDLYL